MVTKERICVDYMVRLASEAARRGTVSAEVRIVWRVVVVVIEISDDKLCWTIGITTPRMW